MEIQEDSKKQIVSIDGLNEKPGLDKNLQELLYQVKHDDINFNVILDFQSSYIDSHGGMDSLSLTALLRLRKALQESGLKLVLLDLSLEMEKELSEAGVEELLVVVGSKYEALKAFETSS